MASVHQIPERNLDVGHGTQNSLLANAHRILTAATPFCSLLPPLAALANVPLSTREPWGMGMRIAVTSTPNFGTKFGWRWLRPRRVGPLGLLAMTMVFCHSEERSDVGIRPFYDGRGFGPPGSSAPADAVWGVPRERHAGVVVPYGSMTGGAKRWADVGIGPYGSDVGNTQRRHDGPPGPAGATLVVPSGRGGRRGCYVSSHWRE